MRMPHTRHTYCVVRATENIFPPQTVLGLFFFLLLSIELRAKDDMLRKCVGIVFREKFPLAAEKRQRPEIRERERKRWENEISCWLLAVYQSPLWQYSRFCCHHNHRHRNRLVCGCVHSVEEQFFNCPDIQREIASQSVEPPDARSVSDQMPPINQIQNISQNRWTVHEKRTVREWMLRILFNAHTHTHTAWLSIDDLFPIGAVMAAGC